MFLYVQSNWSCANTYTANDFSATACKVKTFS